MDKRHFAMDTWFEFVLLSKGIGYSGDSDSSDRHGFGGDGTRRGQGFSAPRNTEAFWRKHPKMSYTPVLIDDDEWTDDYYQLEQRYFGPRYVEELDCYLPGHIGKNGYGPHGVMCASSSV
jgi:hypothetical protein